MVNLSMISKKAAHASVATAATCALVLGAAGSAVAASSGATSGAPTARKGTTLQLSSVEIQRHNRINVSPKVTTRTLKLRATVRDTNGATVPTVTSVAITLAQYDRKRGTEVADDKAVIPDTVVNLSLAKQRKKSATFTGSVLLDKAAIAAKLPAGTRTRLCIKSATPIVYPKGATLKSPAKKVTKKLSGGDCVWVVNIDPS
ncbi:MAG: hypothetical protein WCF04_12405 [Candidatus Nanopelagicales bacterium]